MGMYGMGGICKTTLAKAVYNHICDGFEGSSCLLNVREVSEQSNGLIQLQEQLLFDILKVKMFLIGNVDKGISLIKQRLHRKRVLVVLDDVDRLDQIYALARNGEWFFGPGSRVIITTRDEHLLDKLGVNYSYIKVEKMNHSDSLQLLSWHAFNMPHPGENFGEISTAAVDYAGGLPLALEVLGSELRGRSIIKWKTTLERFKKSPNAHIQKILGISFESLDHTTREVFLDIACFFMGVNIEYVFKILEECGSFPDIAINILVQRSLVKIDYPNLRMHDFIRDMGREIVRQESRHPGKRSRLRSHEDMLKVLKNHTGSEVVEGLSLTPPIHEDHVISLESEAFSKMKNLRLLQIKGVKNLKLEGCSEHLSKELRWICWHSCPLRFLPPRLHLENLVVLDMQCSKIKQVWKLENNILNKLKVLNLSFCENLTKSPNFLQVPNLEELILEGCTGLVELHESNGYLKGLVLLNLNGCKSLMNLPESIYKLKSLKFFHMGRCFNIMRNIADRTTINLPNRSWNPRNFVRASLHVFGSLVKLGLRNSNLLEGDFPIDFGGLSSLQDLDLSVNNFRELPHGICHLPKLACLNLAESRSIRSISTLPANLRILFAFSCESLERISISESRLDALVLRDCHKLVDIQGFENLSFTIAVCLEGCPEREEDTDFVKSLLQLQKWKWPSRIERRQISLYGDEVPSWFSHKRKGSSISFHIPSLVSDHEGVINGLVFGVVCRNKNSTLHAWHGEISVVFHNKTRGHIQVIDRIFYYTIRSLDYLILLQVGVDGGGKIRPYDLEMINGEEIEVSFEFECSQELEYVAVKKCGVHLLIIQRAEECSTVYNTKKKNKNMIEDDMIDTQPVTMLIRDIPHNQPMHRDYDGLGSYVSYLDCVKSALTS
ncbi:LOW QUALITY PROTEIN: disease resistance protein RUN1-like [Juglans microcarpa x Juglans regia]|uniref:LOW QUALITY PROTEIN: disease resistance protein RUN1-like n=1 Tax=Juglans microcarpa x Juglans regia TaxID=2249226 RepID=UPI001B7EF748|nr:LOW QUALITY PROTEIN: disease resistance protein RUN1-like [Juglans microcarpa x Juglans regia]